MPLLFCLGQNDALKAVQASLRPSERLFATHCLRMLCGTPESKFMLGKPSHTTAQEFVQKHVIVRNKRHDWSHKRRGCGEEA